MPSVGETFYSLNGLGEGARVIAAKHGFHEHVPAYDGDARDIRHILSWLALVGTEVSEAVEAVRKGLSKEKFASELADIIIRTVDIAASLNIDLDTAVEAKMMKNANRPFLHGGKRA